MPEYPITIWHSTLGCGDGQDHATRGYLRSLMSVGYEHVVINPRGTYQSTDDLEDIDPLMSYPKKYRQEIIRVKEGDPRIGKKWPNIESGMPSMALGSTTEMMAFSWDNTIQAGDRDHDYYKSHPEEANSKWVPKAELFVCHYDPGQLARSRDAVARDTEGEAPIVGITAWEPDRIPMATAQQLSDLDMLIVPSQHTADSLRRSGLDEACPIRVIPHCLSTPIITEEEIKNRTARYLFYTIGTDIPRKNLETVIAAYLLAFKDIHYEGVGLVVKTNGNIGQCESLKHRALERAGLTYMPRIPVIGKRLSDQEIRMLHVQGDCWVDATRGEGFGLGVAEASIMGNPIITTGWGAQTEIIGNQLYIDYEMEPVDDSMAGFGPYNSSQKWADPKLESLIDCMKLTFRYRTNKSLDLAKTAFEMYSPQSIGKCISEALNEAKENF
jgi:glycosyltransferase involved in cell wall biosynthesis